MFQVVADGLIIGSVISLGAIGLSLTLSILRFSNFSHGELLAWGAYFALFAAAGLTSMGEGLDTPIGPFSFGWGLAIAMVAAAAMTALLALALDIVLFKRLRKHGSITLVIGSFGAALVLRNLLLFWQGGVPKYFSQNLQIAIPLLPRSFGGGLRFTPDQLLVLALTLATVSGLHVFLRYSVLGRSMRAASLNPGLAQVTGIDPERVVRTTWADRRCAGRSGRSLRRHHGAIAANHGSRAFAAAVCGRHSGWHRFRLGGGVGWFVGWTGRERIREPDGGGVSDGRCIHRVDRDSASETERSLRRASLMQMVLGWVSYASFFLVFATIFSIITLGLNLQWGFTGLFNVGVAGFVAIGAYTSALLTAPKAADRLGWLGMARCRGNDRGHSRDGIGWTSGWRNGAASAPRLSGDHNFRHSGRNTNGS